MFLIRLIFLFLIGASSFATAQQTQTFSNYVKGLPVATLPLMGSEPTVILQSGVAHQTTVTAMSSPGLQIPYSDNFFKQNGGIINEINNRMLVGGASVNDGGFPGNQDWLSQFQIGIGLANGTMDTAQGGVLNNNNSAAAVGWLAGVQTLHFTSAGTTGLATSSFAVNNNTTLATGAWAYYGECHNTTAAVSSCYGIEVDPRTTVTAMFPDPYGQGNVVGVQIACGAGVASTGHPCSTAAEIIQNPETFGSGIVFNNGSITSGGGAGGTTPAIALPSGYHILWDTGAATFGGSITVNSSKQLIAKATGEEWQNSSGASIFDCNVMSAGTCTFNGTFVNINGGAGLVLQSGGALTWESGSDAFSVFDNGTQLQFQHAFSGRLGVITSTGDLSGWGGIDNTPIGAVTPTAGTFTVLQFNTGISANGTLGVSCAAGTVSTATLTITNGIVTHC